MPILCFQDFFYCPCHFPRSSIIPRTSDFDDFFKRSGIVQGLTALILVSKTGLHLPETFIWQKFVFGGEKCSPTPQSQQAEKPLPDSSSGTLFDFYLKLPTTFLEERLKRLQTFFQQQSFRGASRINSKQNCLLSVLFKKILLFPRTS